VAPAGIGSGRGLRWRRSVLVVPAGGGGAGGRWWRRYVLAAAVGFDGAGGRRWRRWEVVAPVRVGSGGGSWLRGRAAVAPVGVGGGGRRRWRRRELAAGEGGGGAGTNVSKGGVNAAGREVSVREHLSAGSFSVLSEFVSMGGGTSAGVAVAVLGVAVTLLPPPRPPPLWRRWTTYIPTSRVSLQSHRPRHRKNETAVPWRRRSCFSFSAVAPPSTAMKTKTAPYLGAVERRSVLFSFRMLVRALSKVSNYSNVNGADGWGRLFRQCRWAISSLARFY